MGALALEVTVVTDQYEHNRQDLPGPDEAHGVAAHPAIVNPPPEDAAQVPQSADGSAASGGVIDVPATGLEDDEAVETPSFCIEPADAEATKEGDTAAAPAEPGEPAPPKAKRPRKSAEEPASAAPAAPKSENMNWYILKVQSNREESIREGLLRRVAIHGLDRFFDEVIVPTEKVTEFKGGKKRVIKRKLYPGYLVVHMEINEDTW